jgi:hypothetical protein
MPTFETPQPVAVTIDLSLGDARIIATDRTDTVVDVRPSDAANPADVQAAEQTHVEYAAGRLLVKAPKQRGLGLFSKPGSTDVTIELPSGSQLHGDAAAAAFRCAGRLGECRVKTATGDIRLDQAGRLDLKTSTGDISVAQAGGNAEVTGAGQVHIGRIDGTATIKNLNGDTRIGTVSGDARLNSANGSIVVDHAQAGVTASTANGDIRIGEVVRGTVALKTAYGELEVGIRYGCAAWLDVSTQFGTVRNELNTAEDPGPSGDTVRVRARTSYGDIVIRRA